MSSIFNKTIQNVETLKGSYESILGDISRVAKDLRVKFLKDGTIMQVPELNADEAGAVSLCAIDGASASEKMQSADILVAGASLHDGAASKKIYQSGDESTPFMAYSDIRIHSSKNDGILSGMRAFTEISVLGQAPHDVSIIDGAYLGNVLTVLYQLQDSTETAEKFIQSLREDTDRNFIKGMKKIFDLNERAKAGSEVVALAKSDSSRDMVKEYVRSSDFFATDKILAEYLLEPGEILSPLPVKANRGRVSMIEWDSSADTWHGFKWWNPKKSLSPADYALVEELFSLGGNDKEELFNLYTYLYENKSYHYAYFKPTGFSRNSHALRLEFTTKGLDLSVPADRNYLNDKALELSGYINSDVLDAGIKEPFSQFMVDKAVKEPVSTSMKYLKTVIPGMVRDDYSLGLVNSYRS